METVKELWIKFWKNVWETLKSSFIALLMYFGVSSIVFMSTFQGELKAGMTGERAAWIFGGIAVGLIYHGFTMFAMGGQGYEMLVSGNMKRRSAEALGTSMKISSHKEEKEFRYWRLDTVRIDFDPSKCFGSVCFNKFTQSVNFFTSDFVAHVFCIDSSY